MKKRRNHMNSEASLRLVLPAPKDAPCDRRDLVRWTDRGGPMPRRLARHLDGCPPCSAYARRISRVHTTLNGLRAAPTPMSLFERTGQKALRMLRRAVRASEDARRALRARPNLSTWQRAQLHVARVSMSAAAALLMLVTRTVVQDGVEQTRAAGEVLAQTHWERHIDPDGAWLDDDLA